MSVIETIDYEDIVTMEEGEITYISISDWDIPAGVNTSIFTQAGSLIVSTAAETPAELTEPEAAGLVLTSNPSVPKKMEWAAPSAGGGAITLTNKSGSDQVAGTVVIFDKTNDEAFKTSNVLNDRRVCGVLAEDIANNASGQVAIKGIVATVKVQGNVSRGDWIIQSSTTGRASSYGSLPPSTGSIGLALTSYSGGGAGTVEVYIDVDVYSATLQIELLGTGVVGSTAGATSVSATHTLSAGSSRIALAFIYVQTQTVTSVTYGGVTMTQVPSGVVAGSNERIYIYYLLEASMPADGSKTVTANFSGSAAAQIAVFTLKNAKQSAPGTAVGNSSAAASTLTVDLTPSVASCFGVTAAGQAAGGTFTHGTGQVEVTDNAAGLGGFSTSYEDFTSTSTQTQSSTTTVGANRMVMIGTVVEPLPF